ncbi:condensation domain-containing protein, partial [Paenibacillus cucumis (ex Kampfer et al. 2016)]
ALQHLVARHEVLRTSFEWEGDVPVQRVQADLTFELEKGNGHTAEEMMEAFVRPFDLSKAPLLRAALGELEGARSLLLIDMHHIISDGTTLSLLIEEFMALYEGKSLPAQRVQYKDYAQWQNQRMSSGVLEQQEAYWLKQYEGEVPVLDLQGDYPRPAVFS